MGKFSGWRDIINRSIRWSSLAGIGSSVPARLTIIAPLIGYLIIYNQAVADLFFFGGSGVPREETLLEMFRSSKLTFLYFGLLWFGLGSALFSLLAPSSVVKHRSGEEYVLAMEAAKSKWQLTSIFQSIGYAAVAYRIGNVEENYNIPERSDFSIEAFSQLDDLLKTVGEATLSFYSSDGSGSPEENGHLVTPLGDVNTAAVLDSMLSQRMVDRYFWDSAYSHLFSQMSREVFYLDYTFQNDRRFYARLSCAICFGFGSFLLIVPTLITSVEVLITP